jgi:hypothetical protein
LSITATTTRRDGTAVRKRFSWSYSRLKNFEACPKKHWHIDIAKDVKEEEGEALEYGNVVHTIMAQYIEKGIVMPPVHEPKLKPWADHVFTFRGIDVRTKGAVVMVEQKLAITESFGPCEFFDREAWFRGIGDVMWKLGPVGYIGDWKTGKVIEDSQQLFLMAQCMFAHHPDLQVIRSSFIWLKEDCESVATIKRSDLAAGWANVMPRVQTLRQAHEQMNYPPRPGGLCRRWCPVKQCPHNGS